MQPDEVICLEHFQAGKIERNFVMRTTMIWVLILAATLLTIGPADAETYGRTGFHLDWWNSDRGDDGFQYHVPIEAGGEYRNFFFKVLTAYAYNEIDPDNGSSRSFDGFVDTKVNLAGPPPFGQEAAPKIGRF